MRGAVALICFVILWLLGIGIYLYCLYLAYLTSFVSLLLTLIFPFFAQIYWIITLSHFTGNFFNNLTILCLAWIAVGILGTVLRRDN
jgi:hypothetical protein